MAPSAIPPPASPEGEQAIDLTSAAPNKNKTTSSGWALGKLPPPSTPTAPLDASKLEVTLTTSPRPVPTPEAANAGPETICTDHMVTAEWNQATGWSAPQLRPYGPLSLMPTASVLHYATECFEGLKCYRGHDGRLRLFRPARNAERMLLSARRVDLPGFEPAELEKLVGALLSVDGPRWLPRSRPGTFLYLRPTLIGTQAQLGVMSSRRAMLFVICSFMPELDRPAGGMRLLTSPGDTVRAWVGGFGHAKLGANYGPSLVATAEARAAGFHQVLWLYGPDLECTEAGASNLFFLWKKKKEEAKEEEGDGHEGLELVTAPLDDRIILDGVTRRSVLELARARCPELAVAERKYTIADVVAAHDEGRLVECFASGTAYFVCPVSAVRHRGRELAVPAGKAGTGGRYALLFKEWLRGIMYGDEEHEWGVVVPEKE